MKLSELQKKDVINICTGKKIGNVVDATIDERGMINNISVDNNKFSINPFRNSESVEIGYDSIERIGEDVIIVNLK